MQPPIFPVIGQRLVARIDDGAIELHPLINVVDDVISALAQLEIHLALRLRLLEIERQWIRLPDAPRSGENLARRQKSQQRSENRRRELRLASHQIILVATKRRPGVIVHVVLDERDAVFRAESKERRLQQVVSGQLVRDKIVQMQAFRRCVLDVPHVEIEPPAVQEKSAIARRFLVIAVMKIDRAGVGLAEQIIFDLRRPKLGIHVRLVFAEKTTVLGFDSNHSIHSNQITRRMATWLSQKDVPHLHPLPKMGSSGSHDFRGARAPRGIRLRAFRRGRRKKRAGRPRSPTKKGAESKAHKRPILPRAWHFALYRLVQGDLQFYVNFIVAQGMRLPRHPKIKEITNSTRNIKNRSFAMPADAAAIPPNPKTAATSAMIRKTTAQPNISSPPQRLNRICRLIRAPQFGCS